MSTQRSLPRFVPQASTPDQAYARATTIPSQIRLLAETLLIWSLSNLRHDSRSALGDLTTRFGFRRTSDPEGVDFDLAIKLTPAAALRVRSDHFVCSHPHGSTVVVADRFEPLHGDDDAAPSRAVRPIEPVQWILAWATIARTFQLLGRYEKWALESLTPRMRIAQAGNRPRRAKQSAVPVLEFPQALQAMAEWCSDAELAMMTWVIIDARSRGVEADIPRI